MILDLFVAGIYIGGFFYLRRRGKSRWLALTWPVDVGRMMCAALTEYENKTEPSDDV